MSEPGRDEPSIELELGHVGRDTLSASLESEEGELSNTGLSYDEISREEVPMVELLAVLLSSLRSVIICSDETAVILLVDCTCSYSGCAVALEEVGCTST